MELMSQVNTFTGGLNLDDDITILPKNLYRWATNVRLVTDNEGTSGILLNIEDVRQYEGGLDASEVILGTAITRWYNKTKYKIEECGVVITREIYGGNKINNVYVVTDFNTKKPTWYLILSATLYLLNNLSIVTNFESNDVNKIYITDGSSNIKMINIAKNYGTTKDTPLKNRYQFDIIPEVILFPITLNSLTNGLLQSGTVLYCFLLFNKRGTESSISPLSNVIPLSKDLRNGESKKRFGQLSGESSGLGCVLNVSFNNTSGFDQLRMFRIQYKDNINIPDIYVINEIGISTDNTLNTITYTDDGAQFINKISYDEFTQLVPYDFKATSITKLHNRLFASNITENTWDVDFDARAYRCDSTKTVKLLNSDGNDITGNIEDIINRDIPKEHDCINPYNLDVDIDSTNKYIYRQDGLLGGTGRNVSYKFIFAELVLSSSSSTDGKAVNDLDLNATAASNKTIKLVYENGAAAATQLLNTNNAVIHNYSDAYICAHYTGYMRDEIYRFGIVFYNNKGIPSPVHWIGDIRMPSVKDAASTNSVLYPFHTGAYSTAYGKNVEQLAYAMGIEFSISNIPINAVSWEIVRCDRTESDRTIVSQGILGDLINFDSWEGDGSAGEYAFGQNDIRPLPLFVLSSTAFRVKFHHDDSQFDRLYKASGYYEFVSPEICVSKNSILPNIVNSKIDRLYDVSTFNHYQKSEINGITVRQLGYKQSQIDVVWSDDKQAADKWFGGLILDNPDDFDQLWFHGGSGPGYLEGDARYWYEKQALFKYYNIRMLSKPNVGNLINYHSISDAIIGASLPYMNNLNDSKNHAQSIGNKMYTNTSIAGLELYSNHGVNCVLNIKDASGISIRKQTSENIDEVYTDLNTTQICNIKRNIVPYNGNTYASRQNSIYISCGTNQDRYASKSFCFGGDTYLGIFDYLNTAFCLKSNESKDWKSTRMNTVCYIPMESVVNVNLFSSTSYHNTVNGMLADNLILNEPIVMGSGYVQQKPLYEYNPAYSVQSESLKYITKGMYYLDNLNTVTRITCSELKTNNELIDSWTKFKFANYLDVDSQFGPVTNIKVFKDKLYYFQDSAVGIASVNDRSLITDNNPGQLTLGTGGILARFDYLITQNGNSIVNDKSITNSETTLYWHDFDKNVLCALNLNGFSELSKVKKVLTYLNRLPDTSRKNPVSFFDKKFNEVWFKIYDRCLVYNENLQVFTSFYSHNPNWFFPFSTKLITIKDNNCYYLHNMYDMDVIEKEERVASISFVVNDNVTLTKVFDNQWFTAELDDIVHPNNPRIIKNVFFKTKTQETDPIDYTSIDNREDNYRFAIGRNKQDNPALEEQTNMAYAGRMRGKYLICNYTFDCNNNREFKLPYIKTTYRYSML